MQYFVCDYSIAVEPTRLQQLDMGLLMCAQIWVRAVHTKGGLAQTSLHKCWLGRTEKLPLTLNCQGIDPRVWRSTTVLCPQYSETGFLSPETKHQLHLKNPNCCFFWQELRTDMTFLNRQCAPWHLHLQGVVFLIIFYFFFFKIHFNKYNTMT